MRASAARISEQGTSPALDAPALPAPANDLAGADPAAQRRLTILLLTPSLESGTAAANVVETVRILDAAGHRAVVAAPDGRRAGELRDIGATVVPLGAASVNPLTMLANVARIVRLVRAHDCDVVHAHGRAAAWSASIAARWTGKPFVTTWYKGFRQQNVFKRLYNSVMAKGDAVVAVSDQIADLVGERHRGSAARIRVIPFAVDVLRFDPAGMAPARIATARRVLGVGERTRVLLVVGRMSRRKGHHVVIEAVRQLKAHGLKDFVCVLAGEGAGSSYAGELWDQVLAADAGDVIRLMGPVDDVAAAYAASTVVISAAVQEEGLQRGILEAQAMACPVIVSDLGAGSDAVLSPPAVSEDRMTGLRVTAGDPAALAAALVKVLMLPEVARRAMGARGRAWVAAHFEPSEVARQTLALYSGIADGRRK